MERRFVNAWLLESKGDDHRSTRDKQEAFTPAKWRIKASASVVGKTVRRPGLILLLAEKCPDSGRTRTIRSLS